MSTTFTYRRAAERPGLVLPWQTETAQGTWTNLDLSTGYTFTLTLISSAGATTLSKTSGITGANGSVSISWAAAELDITEGVYTLHLRARDGSNFDRDYRPSDPLQIVIVT
jgi:hypothetical protein